MQCARGKFLARSRWPGDQDAGIGDCYFFNRLTEMVDNDGITDDFARLRRTGAKFFHLALQAGGFKRTFRNQDQSIRFEWLLDEVIGAAFDG